MTHLNRFSYPNRLVLNSFSLVCFLSLSKYVFRYQYFARLKKRKNWDMKFFCFSLCLVVIICWIFYDIMVSIYTYSSSKSSAVKEIADVSLNIVFTSHSSVCFLLIAYFKVLIRDTIDVTNLISELEFKIYVIYSIIAIPGYIIFQYIIRFATKNPLLFVAVPQMIYTLEMTVSSILFFWLIIRVKRRLKSIDALSDELQPPSISYLILKRVIHLIYILIFLNLLIGWSLGIINCFYIGGNIELLPNFWLDLLTSFFSIGYFFMVHTVLLIINVGCENRLTVCTTYHQSKVTKSSIPLGKQRSKPELEPAKSVVSMIESHMGLNNDDYPSDGGVFCGSVNSNDHDVNNYAFPHAV